MTGHDTPAMLVLDNYSQLLASLPASLGFHPTTSLVVVCLSPSPDASMSALGRLMRINLPEPERHSGFVAGMVDAVLQDPTDQTVLVVVDDTAAPETLPHRDLVLACRSALGEAGVPVAVCLWASATTPGSHWVADTTPVVTGVVATAPNLGAFTGRPDDIVYATRDTLAATLEPDEPTVLARRAALISHLAEHDPVLPLDPAGRLAFVEDAIRHAVQGLLPTTDADYARLAISLSDHDVRDALLALPDTDWVQPTEQLWATLLRGIPTPYRWDAACLLAFSAYVRGHVPLATVAIEASDRDHPLTDLLHNARVLGVHPSRIRKAADTAARHARDRIQHDGAAPA